MTVNDVATLILHFDVNGSITAKDTSKKQTDDFMIISLLAEKTVGQWVPSQKFRTYKDYVYNKLLPGEKSNADLKKKRQEVIASFIDWLKQNEHPLYQPVYDKFCEIKQKYTDKTGKINFTLFPSFFTALKDLNTRGIPYIVVLRTFGSDLEDVVEEIQNHPSGVKFHNFCKFQKDGLLHATGTFENGKFKADSEQIIEKVADVFKLFAESQQHFAVQDDWQKWNQDNERARSGKPFLYDSADLRYVSMFFDDNITGDETDDIIWHCELSLDASNTSTQNVAVTVDTLAAMMDEQYFIKHINAALKKIGINNV